MFVLVYGRISFGGRHLAVPGEGLLSVRLRLQGRLAHKQRAALRTRQVEVHYREPCLLCGTPDPTQAETAFYVAHHS